MPRRPELATLAVAATILGGALFGAAIEIGGKRGSYGPEWFFHLGGPWLVLAFVAGLLARRPLWGAALGGLAIASATGGYYLADVWLVGRPAVHYAGKMTVLWGASGAGVGALLGLAGAAARREVPLGWASLAGSLCGEALLLMATKGVSRVFLAEFAAGAALPFAPRGVRARAVAVGLTAVLAVVGIVLAGSLRHAMRIHGWTGP